MMIRLPVCDGRQTTDDDNHHHHHTDTDDDKLTTTVRRCSELRPAKRNCWSILEEGVGSRGEDVVVVGMAGKSLEDEGRYVVYTKMTMKRQHRQQQLPAPTARDRRGAKSLSKTRHFSSLSEKVKTCFYLFSGDECAVVLVARANC